LTSLAAPVPSRAWGRRGFGSDEQPTRRVVEQRVRDRVIEYLELASSMPEDHEVDDR
jgi:hypothetical protein